MVCGVSVCGVWCECGCVWCVVRVWVCVVCGASVGVGVQFVGGGVEVCVKKCVTSEKMVS